MYYPPPKDLKYVFTLMVEILKSIQVNIYG